MANRTNEHEIHDRIQQLEKANEQLQKRQVQYEKREMELMKALVIYQCICLCSPSNRTTCF